MSGLVRMAAAVASLLALASCSHMLAASLVKGGRLVGADFKPEKYLVTYRPAYAAGNTGPNMGMYDLVIDQGKLALYNRNESDVAFVLATHWESNDTDYFAARFGEVAFIVEVPKERNLPARYYEYRKGQFRIETLDGVERPVPTILSAPTALLPIHLVRGGRVVSADFKPGKYLVTYRRAHMGTYHLVIDQGKVALYNGNEGDVGLVLTTHWESGDTDYFAMRLGDEVAVVVEVPKERSLVAKHYEYPKGQFRIETSDGVERPVPTMVRAPIRLLPIKQH